MALEEVAAPHVTTTVAVVPVGTATYQISACRTVFTVENAPDACVALTPAIVTDTTGAALAILAKRTTATTRVGSAAPMLGSPPELYVTVVKPLESSLLSSHVRENGISGA
jgi:hypothetical protein